VLVLVDIVAHISWHDVLDGVKHFSFTAITAATGAPVIQWARAIWSRSTSATGS